MNKHYTIKNKYTVVDKIGQGKFGTVYKGIYQKTNEFVAIKTEDTRTSYRLLKHETTILKYLQEHGCKYVPVIHWFGVDSGFHVLVMSFYDRSLYDFLLERRDSLEPKTYAAVMCGCIKIVESIHKNYIVHRDIKPQNFMLRGRELFIIDFGLSTFYIDENREHITDLGSQEITGNLRFLSVHIHNGSTPSRRDDLISLGYIYLYMTLRGNLPWDNDADYSIKHIDAIEKYCGSDLLNYLSYCYSLGFQETPYYDGLLKIFGG
jgi:casein kinase 1